MIFHSLKVLKSKHNFKEMPASVWKTISLSKGS